MRSAFLQATLVLVIAALAALLLLEPDTAVAQDGLENPIPTKPIDIAIEPLVLVCVRG